MKNTYTLQGQSFFFNALFILVNLAGLTLITLGFHENFESSKLLFAGIGFGLLALSTFGIVVFKGRLFMSYVSRVLVGSLFIVSGLIKANDPLGFAYKLEEYFEDGALAFRIKEWFNAPGFSLEFLIPMALAFSVIICIAEIVLGVMVLIGGKIKMVSWLLLLMMLFFTFLTWHTASCVQDPSVYERARIKQLEKLGAERNALDASAAKYNVRFNALQGKIRTLQGKLDTKFVDRDVYDANSEIAAIKIEESKTNPDLTIVSKSNGEVVVDELKSPQCVSDCGCFGDAMKGSVGRSLTPKESLWKDIILLYLVFWIFITQWRIKENTAKDNSYIVPISLLFVAFFSYVFGWYFPLIFSLVSLLAALWIRRAGGKVFGNPWGSALVVTILCAIMTTYVLRYEPIKDYRPFAVGSDLKAKMHDGIEGKYESMLQYKNLKTGALKEYSSTSDEYVNSKIWENKDWKYLDMVQKEIITPKLPSISPQEFNPMIYLTDVGKAEKKMKFVQEKLASSSIEGVLLLDKAYNNEIEVAASEYDLVNYDTANFKFIKNIQMADPNAMEISIRDYLLEAPTAFILFSKDLTKADVSEINTLKEIFRAAEKRNIPFVMICAGTRAEIDSWRNKNNFHVPTFGVDFIQMKVVARANPALMILQKGVVKGKYPHRSLPNFEWIQKHVLNKK